MIRRPIWLALIFVFSVLWQNCRDRIFNNPLDPDKDDLGYQIVSVVAIGSIIPVDLTFTDDSIWLIDFSGRILSINHNSGNIIRQIDSAKTANGICYDGANIWVNSRGSAEINKLNMINGQVLKTLYLASGQFYAMDYARDLIYIIDKTTQSVFVINADTGQIVNTISSPSFSLDGICLDEANLWILDAPANTLWQLTQNGQSIAEFQTPDRLPAGLCYRNGYIWLGDQSGKIYKLKF